MELYLKGAEKSESIGTTKGWAQKQWNKRGSGPGTLRAVIEAGTSYEREGV